MAIITSGDLTFDTDKETSGQFGEAQAIEAANFLEGLRAQLDAGEITATEFIDIGSPVAELGINRAVGVEGGGGAAALQGAQGRINKAGFINRPGDPGAAGSIQVVPKLPEKFKSEVFEAVLPENLDPEVRQRILSEIPSDIEFGTDRFEIERERIRQQVEAEQQLTERGVAREEQLTGLEQLLQQQQERSFRQATPILTEQLQTRGLLQTSELESAFGREQARLSGAASDIIAGERLRARKLGLGEELDIQSASRRFQSQGLQREFSLADFQREAQVARQIAELGTPRGGGKGRGEKALGAIQGISAIGQTVSGFLPGK